MATSKNLVVAAIVFIVVTLSCFLLNLPEPLPTHNGMEGVPILGVIVLGGLGYAVTLGLSAFFGLFFAILVFGVLSINSERATSLWVVREIPISSQEWSAYVASLQPGESVLGELIAFVPDTKQDERAPQPGIRFYPINRDTRVAARRAANFLGGYLQSR